MKTYYKYLLDGVIILKKKEDDVTRQIIRLLRLLVQNNLIFKDNFVVCILLYNKINCNNYRAISLLWVAYKILKRIIEERLKKQLEPTILVIQLGFRAQRFIQDWIFVVAEKVMSINKKIYTCEIDMEKHFIVLQGRKYEKL